MTVPGNRRCRGAATLFMVSLLLFSAALATWHLARVMMTEQRLIANDVLAREALTAAQSGIELASVIVADHASDAGEHSPGDPVALEASQHELGAASIALSVFHGEQAGMLEVVSTGTASDGIGTRTVRQRLRRVPWLVQPPATAMTTQSIEHLFGRPPSLMHRLSRRIGCSPCLPGALAESGRPYWVSADDASARLDPGDYGSPGAPLILIIEGDLDPGSDSVIHGLVYVRGAVIDGPGGLSINGALVTETPADNGHNVIVNHDPDILERIDATGPLVRVGGSWRDF